MRTPKTVSAYTHVTREREVQMPDTAPGPYYVSVRDGERVALASGPYSTHAEALALVEKARGIARERDPRTAFVSFGTMRMKAEYTRPGVLQQWGYNLELNQFRGEAA